MKVVLLVAAVCVASLPAGCGGNSDDPAAAKPKGPEVVITGPKPKVIVPKGPPPKELEVKELREGSGASVKPGEQVSVQYIGVDFESGKEIDSSWGHGEPLAFFVGKNEVIAGLERGVKGMRVGERRMLIVPPSLAHGEIGMLPAFETSSAVVLVFDLLDSRIR